MTIVNALLEVSSLPEYDITSMTFNFWHSLQVILKKRNSNISFGDEASIEAKSFNHLHSHLWPPAAIMSFITILLHASFEVCNSRYELSKFYLFR